MVEVMEVDNHMSLLLTMNCLSDHEVGRYKRYGLVYLFYTALCVKNVVMFIEYCLVAVAERVGMAG